MEQTKPRKKLSQYGDMLTIQDLCEFLQISRTTAYQFVKSTPITVVRVGREYKISKRSLGDFLNLDS